MKNKKILFVVLKLVFSGLLLTFLYRSTPVANILRLFAEINYLFLPVIFALLLINTVLSALKWQILLRADNINISLFKLTLSYLTGTFFNIFLPSNIGGDSYRIYDVAKQSSQTARSAASVFADRISGFLALILLSLVASFPVAGKIGYPLFFLLPLSLFALLVCMLWMLVWQAPARYILRLLRLDKIPAAAAFCDKFFAACARYSSDWRVLSAVMAISFTFQLSVILVVYLMALALNAHVSLLYFAAFVPVITLMEALPISIYGLGVRDVGYVMFFGLAGMNDVQTRSLALFFLAITVCYSLFGGLVFLTRIILARMNRVEGKPSKTARSKDPDSHGAHEGLG